MTLQIEELRLSSILPIQAGGVSLSRLARIAAEEKTAPIETVIFEDGRSLVVDGHHRAYQAYLEGRRTIPSFHAVDDEGVLCLKSPAIFECFSVEDVHSRYRELWLPRLAAARVLSIVTLSVEDDL